MSKASLRSGNVSDRRYTRLGENLLQSGLLLVTVHHPVSGSQKQVIKYSMTMVHLWHTFYSQKLLHYTFDLEKLLCPTFPIHSNAPHL